MRNFHIITLGCKVNQFESEGIKQCLETAGWKTAEAGEPADLCIINTCAVTGKASMQARQAVRKAVRSNPGAQIVVTGCYAQTEADEIKKIEGVHRIIGHGDKHLIPEMVSERLKAVLPVSICRDISRERVFRQFAASAGNRARPFLKIQDGCDAFCSYCIVPYARGRSRSMPPKDVLNYMEHLEKSGYHEVVLTGIHLGCYGTDLSPETDLEELLDLICISKPIDRVRLSSIEPHELTSGIIRKAASSQIFCRHFHIPLQSGDDRILERMRRPYTNAFFRDLVFNIHEAMPDAAIGVDILAGFPGESEKAFENTYELIKDLPVTYLHVFPFSSRKGTLADKFGDKVPNEAVKERCRRMRELGYDKKKTFYEKFIGKTLDAIIEQTVIGENDMVKGTTSNYIPVFVSGGKESRNKPVEIRIESIRENKASGIVIG